MRKYIRVKIQYYRICMNMQKDTKYSKYNYYI